MGLDMYLNKTKRINDLTLDQIFATEDYIDFLHRSKKYKNYTFKAYCGKDKSLVVQSAIDKIKENYGYDYSPAWAEGLSNYKPMYKTVSKNIAYWRKANAIHNWFVDNIQDGNDDCGNYEVKREDLEKLLDTVSAVLESHDTLIAKELLPTQDGFFFGDTEYDERYFNKLKYTKERIEKILNETDFDNWIVYYDSSW